MSPISGGVEQRLPIHQMESLVCSRTHPAELQFLVTDRGTHFTANDFADLAHDEAFIHVLITRHRPQSNGITERFVRTLKKWLRAKFCSWRFTLAEDAVEE